MTLSHQAHLAQHAALSPARRVAPRCRGGASSLLRLSRVGSARTGLRGASTFADWAHSAAQALEPFVETDFGGDDTPFSIFTELAPSPGVVHIG